MIVEYLEHIPESPVCLRIGRYRIEIMQVKDNMIRSAKVTLDPNVPKADNEH
jgi:Mg2+/Co2+ transporter CorB